MGLANAAALAALGIESDSGILEGNALSAAVEAIPEKSFERRLAETQRGLAECRRWGVTTERLSRMRPGYLVMHPGPINRGIELHPEVADGEHSVILPQVTNGVAVRMAVLYLLAGGSERVTGA